MPHSVSLSTVQNIVVPFCEIFPTACSKPGTSLLQSFWHATHVTLAGSPYFTTSADGVNTGYSVQLGSVRKKHYMQLFARKIFTIHPAHLSCFQCISVAGPIWARHKWLKPAPCLRMSFFMYRRSWWCPWSRWEKFPWKWKVKNMITIIDQLSVTNIRM